MTDRPALPTEAVGAEAVNSLAGVPTAEIVHDLTVMGMFMQADWVVKSVMLLLVFASIWSWKIIFDKLMRFRRIHQQMQDFEDNIWTGEALEKRYDELKHSASHPMARVFVAGMYEWLSASQNRRRKRSGKTTPADDRQQTLLIDPPDDSTESSMLKLGIKERVLQVMDSTRNREVRELERHLGFLATTGSAAPFIGLFGTVWGIMNSFQNIANMQNTSLAVVAPGIAEALLATAIGLFAAIPAVIFYNKFANQASDFSDRIDSFTDEFGSVVARELDRE